MDSTTQQFERKLGSIFYQGFTLVDGLDHRTARRKAAAMCGLRESDPVFQKATTGNTDSPVFAHNSPTDQAPVLKSFQIKTRGGKAWGTMQFKDQAEANKFGRETVLDFESATPVPDATPLPPANESERLMGEYEVLLIESGLSPEAARIAART